MPRYSYECPECGPFEAYQPMVLFDAPHPCPDCEEPAPRLVSAPHFAGMDADRRNAFIVNERSAHAPRAQSGHRHGPNCGCAGGGAPGTGAQRVKTATGSRPWMISH